jgi:tRNA (adenine37-N6)-methyltransferase
VSGVPDPELVAPIAFRPIGIIRTPFETVDGMPIQASAAVGIRGRIELEPGLAAGLADLGGFSHLILIYHLHEIRAPRLTVLPFLDDRPHGIFATRSPARPNPIGLSTVRLVGVDGTTLVVEDVDMLDGTPLLDLKPYVPAFDDRPGARAGWFEERLGELPDTRSDRRFEADPEPG